MGTLAPAIGSTTAFTAARKLMDGTVTATVAGGTGTIAATATLHVTTGRLRIGSISYRRVKRVAFVAVTAVDTAGKPISGATLSVIVRRDGRRRLSVRAATGPAGRFVFRMPARAGGCFSATITRVFAAGFTWDGRTPHNRYCLRRSR